MPPLSIALAFVAGIVAGAINSVAGGGTLLSYPTLLYGLGLEARIANATNAMALWPAALAGSWGFRNTRPPSRALIAAFCGAGILGGITGALLMRASSEQQFKNIVPWLILMAATLFLFQGQIARLTGAEKASEAEMEPARPARISAFGLFFQFLVGVYGGYFGAGIGIIMLAAMSLMRVGDIYQISFLKNLAAFSINLTAALFFGSWGLVNWPVAGIMAAGAVLGGYCGAGLAKKIGPHKLRMAISVIGILFAAHMLWKQLSGA